MRYSRIAHIDAVSQWRDAYINYEYLKVFIAAIVKMVDGVIDHEERSQQIASIDQGDQLMAGRNQSANRLKILGSEVNEMFLKQIRSQREICQMFLKIKLNEIILNEKMIGKYNSISDQEEKKNVLRMFVEYTYIEAVYYSNMLETCQQQEKRILKKHSKSVEARVEVIEAQMQDFVKFPSQCILQIIQKLQNRYLQICLNEKTSFIKRLNQKFKKADNKTSKMYLRNLPKTPEVKKSQPFAFGLFVGLFISVIVFMCIILSYKGLTIQRDPIFIRDFPVWRGIAFVILYIWALGFVYFYYQKFKINLYTIIDTEQQQKTIFTSLFNISSILSAIFGLMFALYVLSTSGIIDVGAFPPRYFALIVWVLFAFFLFNPLPTKYHDSRFFIFKTLIMFMYSPLPCVSQPFVVKWYATQIASLIVPFSDLIYTVCYYSAINFDSYESKSNPCKYHSKLGTFILSVILFGYGFAHIAKASWKSKKFFFTTQFFNFIKNLLSITILVLSFLWNKSISETIFPAWLTFTLLKVLYHYIWDMKNQFGLFNLNAQYWMLRDKIIFKPAFYYVMFIINFLMRLSWIFTFCPNIVEGVFGSGELFKLLTGALEVFRRAIYNLIYIEKKFIDQCKDLKAQPQHYDRLKKSIQQKIKENGQKEGNKKFSIPTNQDLVLNRQNRNNLKLDGSKQSLQANPEIEDNQAWIVEPKKEQLSMEKLLQKIRNHEKDMKECRKKLKIKQEQCEQIIQSLRNR